jgi:NADH:ubiquinone oxidoreductase subunit D
MSIATTTFDRTGPEANARSEDYLWTLNFGPQHPATHTTLRLVLKLDGERVVDATPEMGYLHSGFEKIGEHLTFNQYVTVTDRMNYISPMANNVAWHHAVETLLGIELTPRCRYIRTIIAELARISARVTAYEWHEMPEVAPGGDRWVDARASDDDAAARWEAGAPVDAKAGR